MAWTRNLTGDENGQVAYEANANGDVNPQTRVQNIPQSVTPFQKLYFSIRLFIPTGYSGAFHVGFEQWDGADPAQQLADYLFIIPNGELTPNSWQTLSGEMIVPNANTVTIKPLFEVPANATGGIVKISEIEMAPNYVGSTQFVDGVAAEIIRTQAQIAEDLTTNNGIQAHPSSIPAIAVTQHSGMVNALDLLNAPAEAGANVGGQFGVDVTDESGNPVTNLNAKNEFTATDNMITDPMFSDSALNAWFIESGGYWSATLGEGSSSCAVLSGSGWTGVESSGDRDVLIPCAEGQTVYFSAKVYRASLTGTATGTQFFIYQYDENVTFLGAIYGSEFATAGNTWVTGVRGDITPTHNRCKFIRVGIRQNVSAFGSLRVNWIRATLNKPADYNDIAPTRLTNAYFADFISNKDNGGSLEFGPVYNATYGGTHWYLNGPVRSGAMYAPIYYDSDNPSNGILDMVGVSYLNDLRLNILFDRENTGYYWHGASTSRMHLIDANDVRSSIYYDRNDTTFAIHGDSTSVLNILRVSSIQDRNSTGFTWDGNNTSRMFRADLNDTRSDIYYDRNDTSHYSDMAGTSNFNHLRTDRYSATAQSNTPSLEIVGNGAGAATMAFHRGGSQAVNFGLDPNHSVYLGGWSWTASAHRWQGDGKYTAKNVIYSTSWSDLDNTDNWMSGGDISLESVSPTIRMRDTDHRSGFLHTNSNRVYVLQGTTNAYSWSQVNGQWPVYFQLDTNHAYFGAGANFVGSVAQNTSDGRLKTNKRVLQNVSEGLRECRGYLYDWKKDETLWFGAKSEHDEFEDQLGCMTQEWEKWFPQVVAPAPFDHEPSLDNPHKLISKSGKDFKTLRYEMMTPILLEGWHEHDGEILLLKSKVQDLEAEVNSLKNNFQLQKAA